MKQVVICPKCKKEMRDVTPLMMLAERECKACDVRWEHRLGFNDHNWFDEKSQKK